MSNIGIFTSLFVVIVWSSSLPTGATKSDHDFVEVDLREGIVRGYSDYIEFLEAPKPSRSQKCDSTAVIKIDFSGPFTTAKLQLVYDRPRLWTLDISDSPSGDGNGGDNGTTSNMAEAQIFNRQLRIYGNNLPGYLDASINGGLLLKVVDNMVKKGKKMGIEISDEKIEWSQNGQKQFIKSKFLFTLSGQNTSYGNPDYHIYVGMNRVVAGSYRSGSGLCKATITLQGKQVNECADGKHECHRDATCYNTRKSYRCRCKNGFYGNGKLCYDENECEYENGGCVHFCKNAAGDYSCECMKGFEPSVTDEHNCVDVNECLIYRGGCQHQCLNTLGSYLCRCNAGYSLQEDGHNCTMRTWCSEKLGCDHHCQYDAQSSGTRGMTCACRPGYLLHANKRTCLATCAIGNGGCQHKCTDTADGAVCSCHVKYMLHADGRHCIATCRVDNGGCDRKCDDTPSGPQCSCPPGFTLHQDRKTCLDVDECSTGMAGCSHTCINNHGSYECTCPHGFQVRNYNNTCFDVDECQRDGICDHTCVNTAGSFTCYCNQGYQLYGQTHCADINECSIHNGGCAHRCENTEGSYTCKCNAGYVLQANSKDCERTQRCIVLQAPLNGRLKCTRTELTEYCSVQCNDGTHFTSTAAQKGPFRCGPITNYTWTQISHNFGHITMPSCSSRLGSPTLHRKARFVFLAARCSNSRSRKIKNFQYNFHNTLSDTNMLGCGSECQVSDINVECGSRRKKFLQMAKRANAELVTVEFHLLVSPESRSRQNCDVTCEKSNTERKMKRALKNLRKHINRGQLKVSFDGQLYEMSRKSLKTSSVQQSCSSGYVLTGNDCVVCSQGTYYEAENLECKSCPSGFYQDEEGQTSCKQCSHSLPGVGLEGAYNMAQCNSQCVPGTYSRTGLRPCVPCQRGTYQPSYGRTTCMSCPPGISTATTGSANFSHCQSRVRCPPGQYFEQSRQLCRICPKNKYQGNPGENYCIDCPGNTTTDEPGATDASACKNRQCGGKMGELQGYIETPNWPGQYPSNVECTWNIVPQKGRRILIIVPTIFLASQDKCADFLVMRKSASPYSLTTFETCETRETPIAFTARSRKLWIQFKTDSHNSATGFSIPYVTYNEEYHDLIEDIVRDGRLYSLHQHQRILQDRILLSALLEVIAQPYNYFKYANVSSSMFPESFIKFLTPKVRRFFT